MFNMDQMTTTSLMNNNNNFISSNNSFNNRNNWIGANDVFGDNFEWANQRQRQSDTPAGGAIGQCHPQNEWSTDYESKSSSTDESAAHHDLLASPPEVPPPRPQRPFTEYNVFFQLERELLLQDNSDVSDDLEKSEASQKILSAGKEIESPDVAALRPPQYRHLVLSVDWYVVGNKYKSAAIKRSDSHSNTSSNSAPTKKRASVKKKESHGKITFLELTKLISSKWREVCQNDHVTKEFCKTVAIGEAARYKKELEEYRYKYGAEAAKGKKRKPRKGILSSEVRKKTKQVNEEVEEIDMLNNFVPIEGELEEDVLVSSQPIRQQVPFAVSDLGGSSHLHSDGVLNMYARQQEIQAQLLQQRQRMITSPQMCSSFTVNTFQGIPKDFSQSQTFQGAIITPADPYAQGRQMLQDGYDHLQKRRQMLQDEYDRLQRLENETCAMRRRNAGQSFVRQNSAFGSKYDFLNSVDGNIADEKVDEFLRDYEHKVSRQVSKSSPQEEEDAAAAAAGAMGIDRDLYLKKLHRKCIEKKSRFSPSEVSRFNLVNNSTTTTTTTAPKLKKLRSLQSNDWALFTEHVEIKGDEDITTTFM